MNLKGENSGKLCVPTVASADGSFSVLMIFDIIPLHLVLISVMLLPTLHPPSSDGQIFLLEMQKEIVMSSALTPLYHEVSLFHKLMQKRRIIWNTNRP